MDEKKLIRFRPRFVWMVRSITGLVCCLLLFGGRPCAGAEFLQDFNDTTSGETSWTVHFDQRQCRVTQHRRLNEDRQGRGAEYLSFQAADAGTPVELTHDLPPTQVIMDETELSLWVRSHMSGCRLSVRLVFPHQVDTRTNKKPLAVRFVGETYQNEEQWQQLRCRLSKKEVLRLVGGLRNYHGTDIDLREMYVDRAYLSSPGIAGPVEFLLDDLQLGPLVKPQEIVPVDHREESTSRSSPVKFGLGQLTVEDKPTFLRILPYHHEDPAELAQMRFNIAWIPNFQDTAVLRDLRSAGLWSIAIPPQAVDDNGELLDASTASMAPFGDETSGLLAWYLGTKIPAEDKDRVLNWIKQLRGADRLYNRPFMGDVTGLEFTYSRYFKMLGTSRKVLHTDLNFREYREALIDKRQAARPGSFIWTWVDTEADPRLDDGRQLIGWHPVVVEPEQIRLQVYAALQAGSRGIGFMKTTSLDEERPGAVERKLIIQLLNMELDLIEPWLSTGTVRSIKPVQMTLRKQELTRGNLFGGSARARQIKGQLLRAQADNLEQQRRISRELEAAVLETIDGSLVVLPAWLEEGAQFVPGRLAGQNARIIIPGVSTTSVAYELTTTGVRSLDGQTERRAGGLEITLKEFDQTAMVLITSNHQLKRRLDEQARAMAAESAELSIQLAAAKMERVRRIDRELVEMGYAQGDGLSLLEQANQRYLRARDAMNRHDYHSARLLSGECMQALRILQRAHWNDTVRNLSHPVSSPHTLCFETLPDHWEMMARFGSKTTAPENLLRSGNFEDIDTMIAEGWQHKQRRMKGVAGIAELAAKPSPRGGNYSLRLAAVPIDPKKAPRIVIEPPVTVSTPPLMLQSGQLVHISGRIKIRRSISGSADGVQLFDDITGPDQALRWNEAGEWQYFDLIREVPSSRSLTITIRLNGLGDVLFDQLRVIAVDSSTSLSEMQRERHYDPRNIMSGTINRQRMQNISDQRSREQQQRLRRLQQLDQRTRR